MKQKLVTIFWNISSLTDLNTPLDPAWKKTYPDTDVTEHLNDYLAKGWVIESITPVTTGDGSYGLLAVLLTK